MMQTNNNDRWGSLSMQERAQLLGIYASKGYTDLAKIISHYNSFATGGALPDHDPNNPYHYHNAKGEKIVITPEDWEANVGKPYFREIEAAVKAEQAAHPEPEYEVNPGFVRDLRSTYAGNIGNGYQNYRNFSSSLPQGYMFTDEGLIVDQQGNYYVQSGYRQSPRFTYSTDNPLRFTINKGKPIEKDLTFYPVNMDKRVKAPLPVDRVMNVNNEREKAIENYIETNTTPKQRINYINSIWVSYLHPELATSDEKKDHYRGIRDARKLGYNHIIDNFEPGQFNGWLIGFTDKDWNKFKQDLWNKASYEYNGKKYISVDGNDYDETLFFNPNWYINTANSISGPVNWSDGPKGNQGFQTRYIGGKPSNQEAEKKAVISVDPLEKVNTFATGGIVNDPPVDPVLKGRQPKANFYQRLLNPFRQTMPNWENRINNKNNVATHKLSWVTDSNGNAIVYPNVQEINGRLYDFTDPRNKAGKWDAVDRAIQTGDTIQMTPEQANFWTQHYKEFYPSFNFATGGHLYQDGGPDGSKKDKNNKGHVTFGTYDEYGNIIPMYRLNQVNVGATQPYRTPEQEAQVTRERNMYFDAMRHFNYGNQDAEGLKETYAKYPELRSYLKRIGMSENDFMSAATGRDYETNSYERERTRQFNKDIQKTETDRANTFMQAVQHQNPNDQKLAAIMTGILGGVTGTGILSGAGLLDGVVSGASKVLTNPIVDAGLTVHGAITAPNNIKEGISELQEGRYGAGALDLGMTALDLLGAGQLVTRTGRMLSPAYRAKHAYNAVAPVGYQGVKDKAKSWLRDMWYNEPVDLKNPKWYREGKDNPGNLQGIDNSDVRLGVTGTADYITPGTKNADRIGDEARLDAWAIYNGLPQQYGTYIKNADGTYSYDMDRIMRLSEGTWSPAYTPETMPYTLRLQASNGLDFVTGAGGGLTDFRVLATDKHGNGIMHLEDVWDLHPFSRPTDLLGERLGVGKPFYKIGNKLEQLGSKFSIDQKEFKKFLSHYGGDIDNVPEEMWEIVDFSKDSKAGDLLKKAGKTTRNLGAKTTEAFNKTLKNFEVGAVTGGKPFKMSTDIKYHTANNTVSGLKFKDGRIVFEKTPRTVLKYGFNPDWIVNLQPTSVMDKFDAYDLEAIQDIIKNASNKNVHIFGPGGPTKTYNIQPLTPVTAVSDNTRVALQPSNLFEEQFQQALQAEEEAKAQAEFERRQARIAKNEAEARAREAERRAKTPAMLREQTPAERAAAYSNIKVTTPVNTGVIYDKTRAELEEQAANWGRSVGSVATMTPEMVSRNPLTAVALGGLGEMAFLSGRYPFTNFRQTLSTAGELLSPSTYTELLGASPVVGNLANTTLGADIAYHSIQDLPEAAESFRLNNDLGSGLRTGLDLLGVSPLYSMGKAGVGLVGDAANTVKPYFKNVSRYDHRNIFQKLLGKPKGKPYIEDEFTINMDRWLKSPREYKLQSEFDDKKALRNEAVYNLRHGDIGEVKIPYDQSAATKIESSVFNPTMSDFSVFIDGKRIHGTTKNLSTEIVSPIDYSQQAINTIGHPISRQDSWVPNIIRNNNGYVFPIENNPEFTTELAKHIQELEAKGYPVVGSSRVISKGYIGGQPGDVEIIAPATDRAVYDSFGFIKQRNTRGGTGVTGRSPLVMDSAESNNLDINLLDDSGTIIHQLESTRMPEKMPSIYSREARKASTQLGEPTLSRDLRIPKDTGDGTYKAQEYFDLVKNDEKLLDQSVIDNMFKADSDKAFQRAYVMMNNSDPRSIELTTTAIDHMHKQIPGMKKFSELYPSEKFENVEHNKEILKKIGFTPFDIEKFASNPKQMRNIVDYWYMRKYVGGRSVNFDSTKNLSFDEVMIPLRQLDNMSTAGGGGNFVSGSKHGGFVRNYTSYVNYEPIVENEATATFDDVFNAFERERTVFKDEDKVKGAIEKVLKNTDLKLTDFRRFDSRFTDDVMDLVNAGRISNQEGDMIIQKVAEELGVSGFRGTRYNDHGDYFGGMQRSANYIGQKGSPKVAFRSVDAGEKDVVLPAEWGTDKMFNLMSSNNAKFITDFSPEYPVLSFEELKRTVPQAVEDYRFPITKNDVKTYFIDKTHPYFQEELNKTLESLPENSYKLWDFVLDNRYRMHNGLNDIPVAPELEAKIARVVKEDASKVARQNMLYDKKQQAFKDYYKRVKTLKNVGIYGGIGVGSIGAGIGGHDLLATIINNNEKIDWELANINELDEMVKKEIGPVPDSDAPDKEWKDYLKKEKAIYNREYKKYKNASSKLHNMTINSNDSY